MKGRRLQEGGAWGFGVSLLLAAVAFTLPVPRVWGLGCLIVGGLAGLASWAPEKSGDAPRHPPAT